MLKLCVVIVGLGCGVFSASAEESESATHDLWWCPSGDVSEPCNCHYGAAQQYQTCSSGQYCDGQAGVCK